MALENDIHVAWDLTSLGRRLGGQIPLPELEQKWADAIDNAFDKIRLGKRREAIYALGEVVEIAEKLIREAEER